MRDHPKHLNAVLGGTWGCRLTNPGIREKWQESWEKFDEVNVASEEGYGMDQGLMQYYVWPWAVTMSMQHDSYG